MNGFRAAKRRSGFILPAMIGLFVLLSGCRSRAMQYWMVGQLELETGNIPRAIEAFEKSKRLDPDFPPPYLALAAARTRTGDMESVAENLQNYLKLSPDHTAAHLYLAECKATLGEVDQSRQHLLRFIRECDPQAPANINRLAHAYRRLAEWTDPDENPFDHHLYAGVGLLYESRRQVCPADRKEALLSEALTQLQAARKRNPEDPTARRHLADCLAALDNLDSSSAANEPQVATQDDPITP